MVGEDPHRRPFLSLFLFFYFLWVKQELWRCPPLNPHPHPAPSLNSTLAGPASEQCLMPGQCLGTLHLALQRLWPRLRGDAHTHAQTPATGAESVPFPGHSSPAFYQESSWLCAGLCAIVLPCQCKNNFGRGVGVNAEAAFVQSYGLIYVQISRSTARMCAAVVFHQGVSTQGHGST